MGWNTLCGRIDAVAKEKGFQPIIFNNNVMPASVEPCKHHHRNAHLNFLAKEFENFLKRLLDENSDIIDANLCTHLDLVSVARALDKKLSLARNCP